MVCEGGELAFVQQMIQESQVLGPRIHWYTSMLGKKTTMKQLRKELHGLGVTALRTTELVQVRSG
jgi:23S rRNA (adenine1618-N6)-methyltransferase